MFENTKHYARRTWLMAAAWVELQRGKRDLKAAECLYRLNRMAKTGWSQSEIYTLKNQTVCVFYQKGYCKRTVQSVQELVCWHTRGYMEGYEQVCRKCNNTGIFKRVSLFDFTFIIDGQPFNWHQPEDLIDWPVKISAEPVVYRDREAQVWDFGKEQGMADQAMLYVYLVLSGVERKKLPEMGKLRTALRSDRQSIQRAFKRWVAWKLQGLKRKGPLLQKVQDWANDYIPF